MRTAFLFIVVLFFLAMASIRQSHATTIVAKLEKDRIILAADTRRNTLKKSSNPKTDHVFNDDSCKVVALGNFGFAATGDTDYTRVELGDMLGDWNAFQDARTSYTFQGDSLVALADDWGRRAMEHYRTFYTFAPDRVKALAGVNDANILVEGVFAGWDTKGQAALIFVTVAVDEKSVPPIVATRYVLPPRDLPYSTNGYTKELIEGNHEQTSTISKKWQERSKKLLESERDWRWLEFLIQSTSDADETVGKKVDVLKVEPSGSTWLQNAACSAH